MPKASWSGSICRQRRQANSLMRSWCPGRQTTRESCSIRPVTSKESFGRSAKSWPRSSRSSHPPTIGRGQGPRMQPLSLVIEEIFIDDDQADQLIDAGFSVEPSTEDFSRGCRLAGPELFLRLLRLFFGPEFDCPYDGLTYREVLQRAAPTEWNAWTVV